MEELSAVDPSAGVIVDVQNTICNNALLRWATSEQNRRWLDALLQGATLPEKQHYIPPWHNANEIPLQPEEYLKMRQLGKAKQIVVPPVPSESLNKNMSALNPDEVEPEKLTKYKPPAENQNQ